MSSEPQKVSQSSPPPPTSSSSSSSSPQRLEECGDEAIMEVPHEFMEFPLGFVIDSGGSVTKLLYRSNKDYKNGQLLKPSDHGLLRLKYFNVFEIDQILPFLKKHCDIVESEKNRDVQWLMTGVTTQHFKAQLQKEFGIKTKLYSEMLALNTTIASIETLNIGHYEVHHDVLHYIAFLMRGMVSAMKSWAEMGDDFLKAYLEKIEEVNDTAESLEKVEISEKDQQQDQQLQQQKQEQQQQQEPSKQQPQEQSEASPSLSAAMELVSNPDIDMKEWCDKNLESPQGKLVTPCLLMLFGSGCGVLLVDEQMNIKVVDFLGVAGKAFCGIVEEMLGVSDFDLYMKMAEKGDISKVNIHHSDLKNPEHEEKDWYAIFPGDFTAFELGKMTSSYSVEKGGYSKDDVAAGILSFQASILGKVLILNSRLHNVKTVYMCGSFVKYSIARKMIERHFLGESIRCTMEGNPLVKIHFLHNPGFLVGLGIWSANVDIAKKLKESKTEAC